MTDYFPLVKGAMREYAVANAQGTGTFKIEVLSVETRNGSLVARCRRTTHWNGVPLKVYDFEAVKDSEAVRSDGGVEFKLPPAKGSEWIVSPRRYWIEDLDAKVETKAGTFTGCLRVAYLIAEGDGGSGERHYAPGVGLVKIVENDEGDPFTHELIAHSG